MKTVWMVVQYWPGGKRQVAAAYFEEEAARYEAGKWVGRDGALVSLETVSVQDGETAETGASDEKQ